MRAVRGECQHESLYRTREEYHAARRRASWPKISVMFGPSNPISPISTLNLPHIPHNLNPTTLQMIPSSVFSVHTRWLTPPLPPLALGFYGNSVRLNFTHIRIDNLSGSSGNICNPKHEPVLSGLNGIIRNARTTFVGFLWNVYSSFRGVGCLR